MDEENPNALLNLVPGSAPQPENLPLQDERYLGPQETREMAPVAPQELGETTPETSQPPERGQRETFTSRQLSPLVEKAASRIKEGLMKTKSDVWIGIALGAVGVLTARYLIHREL